MRLVREPERFQITGLPKSTAYREMKRGTFPQAIKIKGMHAVAWLESDLHEWVAEQVAASRAGKSA